ncbi:type III secretion apparatus protein, YscQ/HrcQ family [Burkholderia humptydooensis]|uniref:Surface presentation of antigens protein SpaO n=2 Tax=Burkholderia humptydooensis TaxID=430531 RepID=A0ABN0FZK0_9BURK|nr:MULTISPECIES: type III secretion system cytoplasmic ring protein SctQ [Burkholderia]AJY40453.1 type III secretion apparatus protein, YscQ/HrcQ family [Burkholderia sp. 2002721687]ALX46956.1 type III secretion system protein [Burkholderia humptydooensis]EIP85432.1 type III secretion system protein BsaV [Burkholderia humptydooensis MSMB43]
MSARYTLLRRVAPAELPLYRSAQALRAGGEYAALRTIAPPRGYAALRATWRGVEHDGWVDVDDLMRRRYPALGALAWRALDRRYALDLLSGRDAAAELPAPPGGWAHVRLVDLVERKLPAEPLLCFDAPGRVRALFRAFPGEAPAPRAAADVGGVPLAMRFAIGVARLPLALLPAVAPGDVLLVRAPRNVVRIGAYALCEFCWEGENIMLNEPLTEPAVDDPHDDLHDEPTTADALPDASPQAFDVAALPVTLEFVLHDERVTVAQLAGCHPGLVLPLRGAPGEVTIRANGLPFGRGELIQVGEQLAVEVKALWRAKPAACDGE